PRPAADRARRPAPARAALPEPDRERHQVPRRPAPPRPPLRREGRRRVGLLGPRRGDRDRSTVPGAHLCHLPAAPQPARVPGDGDRAGDLPQDRRAPWRPDLAGIGARPGLDLLLHPTRDRGTGTVNRQSTGTPVEILLIEDNPGDVRLT